MFYNSRDIEFFLMVFLVHTVYNAYKISCFCAFQCQISVSFVHCAVRDTRTAEGPNSFSKGKLGFCNRQKVMMRELEEGNESELKK